MIFAWKWRNTAFCHCHRPKTKISEENCHRYEELRKINKNCLNTLLTIDQFSRTKWTWISERNFVPFQSFLLSPGRFFLRILNNFQMTDDVRKIVFSFVSNRPWEERRSFWRAKTSVWEIVSPGQKNNSNPGQSLSYFWSAFTTA